MFPQGTQVIVDVHLQSSTFQLIGFGEDDGERYTVFAQPFHEFEVDGLRFEPAVDEHKEIGHLLTFQDVVFDDGTYLILAFEPATCIAIAGQVDKVPTLVDEVVIDQLGFAGGSAGVGQFFALDEHVDQAAGAHL